MSKQTATSIIVKTSYSEYDFLKTVQGWVLRETRSVKCFRPGAYREVSIKPKALTGSEVKAMLKEIKETKSVHWTKVA